MSGDLNLLPASTGRLLRSRRHLESSHRSSRLGLKDIEDILASHPDVIVMGTGYAGQMRVEEDVRSLLQDRNITLIAARTEEAVREFNRLASEGNDVAAGFHLTC